MFFAVVSSLLLFTSAFATPVMKRDDYHDNDGGLKRICPNLNTADRGCIRYVKGFDVTGVVTEVDLTFPLIRDECDCIQQCLDRPNSCAAWVWKFSTPQSVQSGHRTCTLYSQFNLPTDVTLEINTAQSVGFDLLQPGNNPQTGAPVPQAFKDVNLNTTADPDAVSGAVWQLMNGQALC
ncbi:uncharacterized protein PV09_08619 [Verruconis gallopava]|uniref:Apple domain-containing protein n=1 Tax=Verruconis gallopava TaxID=253628 RepID=A0A0D1XC40_9PEZI|nr:uncharacterized protein PV09_08619 [Verruconis gallopava]KIV99815.1 hypothetical protein PV09_08619 [Verruconis gallopava]